MKPSEIAQKAISKMNKQITNEIFKIIQKDPELMHDYLKAVEAKGLDVVNQTIGKEVKAAYQLTNINDREKDDLCTLIQSHQKFE
jgi:hypothetical protein